jgi:hypothetical protein
MKYHECPESYSKLISFKLEPEDLTLLSQQPSGPDSKPNEFNLFFHNCYSFLYTPSV